MADLFVALRHFKRHIVAIHFNSAMPLEPLEGVVERTTYIDMTTVAIIIASISSIEQCAQKVVGARRLAKKNTPKVFEMQSTNNLKTVRQIFFKK